MKRRLLGVVLSMILSRFCLLYTSIQPEKQFHHFGSVTSSGIIEGIRINIKSLCHFIDQIFFWNTNSFFILYNSMSVSYTHLNGWYIQLMIMDLTRK